MYRHYIPLVAFFWVEENTHWDKNILFSALRLTSFQLVRQRRVFTIPDYKSNGCGYYDRCADGKPNPMCDHKLNRRNDGIKHRPNCHESNQFCNPVDQRAKGTAWRYVPRYFVDDFAHNQKNHIFPSADLRDRSAKYRIVLASVKCTSF